MTRFDFAITADASGNATVYSATGVIPRGLVRQIRYVPGTLAAGTDLTITLEGSGLAIATLTDIGTSAVQWAPRQATHSTTGAASLYAAAGQAVNDLIAVCGERIKVSVAQGGNGGTGTLYIWVG